MAYSLYSRLSSRWLDIENHKLSRFDRGKPNVYVDNALVNIRLESRRAITLDKVSIFRCCTLKGSLTVQILHETTDAEAKLCPERLIIRFKHSPTRGPIETFFDKE